MRLSESRTHTPTIAIIPARYESSRFPGKALAELGGRLLIEHVYRRASEVTAIDRVIVATDDPRIVAAVEAFGGIARLTSRHHASGTDRLAELAVDLSCDLIVNVQGDEPLIAPRAIADALAPFASDPSLVLATLRHRITDPADLIDPNVVKVVVDRQGFALYFSRSPIPFAFEEADRPAVYKHIGLYVYRRETLLRLAALPPTALERSERLEQLRALEHGYRMLAVETVHDSIGVDTPADLERVRGVLAGLREPSPRGASSVPPRPDKSGAA